MACASYVRILNTLGLVFLFNSRRRYISEISDVYSALGISRFGIRQGQRQAKIRDKMTGLRLYEVEIKSVNRLNRHCITKKEPSASHVRRAGSTCTGARVLSLAI